MEPKKAIHYSEKGLESNPCQQHLELRKIPHPSSMCQILLKFCNQVGTADPISCSQLNQARTAATAVPHFIFSSAGRRLIKDGSASFDKC